MSMAVTLIAGSQIKRTSRASESLEKMEWARTRIFVSRLLFVLVGIEYYACRGTMIVSNFFCYKKYPQDQVSLNQCLDDANSANNIGTMVLNFYLLAAFAAATITIKIYLYK